MRDRALIISCIDVVPISVGQTVYVIKQDDDYPHYRRAYKGTVETISININNSIPNGSCYCDYSFRVKGHNIVYCEYWGKHINNSVFLSEDDANRYVTTANEAIDSAINEKKEAMVKKLSDEGAFLMAVSHCVGGSCNGCPIYATLPNGECSKVLSELAKSKAEKQ